MSGADLAKIVLVVWMNARVISLQKTVFLLFFFRTYKRHTLEDGFVNQIVEVLKVCFQRKYHQNCWNIFLYKILKQIFGVFGHNRRYIIFIDFQNLVNSPSS